MKFKSKPVVIEAIQFDGTDKSVDEMLDTWGQKFQRQISNTQVYGKLAIDTLEGVITASEGDWIICGLAGEFYPCKPAIFAEKYEAING